MLELFAPSPAPTKCPKASPPPVAAGALPSVRLQQARRPSPELFEASPMPPAPEGRPDYSDQRPRRLLDVYPPEPGPTLRAKANAGSAALWRLSCTFPLCSFALLAVASLSLSILGHRRVEGAPSLSGGNDEHLFPFDAAPLLRRRGHPDPRRPPRTFFMGPHPHRASPPLRPTPGGRQLTLYPADFSDVTQLYDAKGSDDAAIAGSMERRFFPRHETNADCVPASAWQTQSFPTCNLLHEMGLGLPSLEDGTLRLLSGAGSWRDAWRFKTRVAPSAGRPRVDNVVVKTLK